MLVLTDHMPLEEVLEFWTKGYARRPKDPVGRAVLACALLEAGLAGELLRGRGLNDAQKAALQSLREGERVDTADLDLDGPRSPLLMVLYRKDLPRFAAFAEAPPKFKPARAEALAILDEAKPETWSFSAARVAFDTVYDALEALKYPKTNRLLFPFLAWCGLKCVTANQVFRQRGQRDKWAVQEVDPLEIGEEMALEDLPRYGGDLITPDARKAKPGLALPPYATAYLLHAWESAVAESEDADGDSTAKRARTGGTFTLPCGDPFRARDIQNRAHVLGVVCREMGSSDCVPLVVVTRDDAVEVVTAGGKVPTLLASIVHALLLGPGYVPVDPARPLQDWEDLVYDESIKSLLDARWAAVHKSVSLRVRKGQQTVAQLATLLCAYRGRVGDARTHGLVERLAEWNLANTVYNAA